MFNAMKDAIKEETVRKIFALDKQLRGENEVTVEV